MAEWNGRGGSGCPLAILVTKRQRKITPSEMARLYAVIAEMSLSFLCNSLTPSGSRALQRFRGVNARQIAQKIVRDKRD